MLHAGHVHWQCGEIGPLGPGDGHHQPPATSPRVVHHAGLDPSIERRGPEVAVHKGAEDFRSRDRNGANPFEKKIQVDNGRVASDEELGRFVFPDFWEHSVENDSRGVWPVDL